MTTGPAPTCATPESKRADSAVAVSAELAVVAVVKIAQEVNDRVVLQTSRPVEGNATAETCRIA
jgi:hypothetical protein